MFFVMALSALLTFLEGSELVILFLETRFEEECEVVGVFVDDCFLFFNRRFGIGHIGCI